MKIKTWPCWCLLFLAGCRSDTDRLRDVEHRFLEIVALPKKHMLAVGKDTLFLPVLPTPEDAAQAKTDAADLQKEMQEIHPEKLSAADQKRLDALKNALNDLVRSGVASPVEQVCMEVAQPFRKIRTLNNPKLTEAFLNYLPEYFAGMEQRWHPPVSDKTPQTIQEAESAFDALQDLQQQAGSGTNEQFRAARFALKDYIGLCQSALLERPSLHN